MIYNLRTGNASLRTVNSFTDRTNCTDRKDIGPHYNFNSTTKIFLVSIITCNLRTVYSSLRTVDSFTDRTNCTDRSNNQPLSNFTSKPINILSIDNEIPFTDRRNNSTDRNLNSRTVTVRVYWTTLVDRAQLYGTTFENQYSLPHALSLKRRRCGPLIF